MMQVEWQAILLCAGASAAAAFTLSRNERKADAALLVCGLLVAGALAALSLPVLAVAQAAVALLAWSISKAVTSSRTGAVVRQAGGGFGYGAAFLALGLLLILLMKILPRVPGQAVRAPMVEETSLVTPAFGLVLLLFAGLSGAIGILRRSRN